MYTYNASKGSLGNFSQRAFGAFGVNPFTTAWRYYTGQPSETDEEYQERLREEGMVESEEARERREAANRAQDASRRQEEERGRVREEAIVRRSEEFARLRAKEAAVARKKTKIIAAVAVGVVWVIIIGLKISRG